MDQLPIARPYQIASHLHAAHKQAKLTMTLDDDIFDDLFHGSTFAAYAELARISGGPPDGEATRRLAYQLYEDALAERHRQP